MAKRIGPGKRKPVKVNASVNKTTSTGVKPYNLSVRSPETINKAYGGGPAPRVGGTKKPVTPVKAANKRQIRVARKMSNAGSGQSARLRRRIRRTR